MENRGKVSSARPVRHDSQDADDGEHLVEPFSHLPLKGICYVCACVISSDDTQQQLLCHMGPLFRGVVVRAVDGARDQDRVRQGLRYAVHGVLAHAKVVVWLKRRLGVRVVQQGRCGSRVAGPVAEGRD